MGQMRAHIHNLVHKSQQIVALERVLQRRHFVEDAAEGPDVRSVPVVFVCTHLWGHVVWGPDDRLRLVKRVLEQARDAEVTEPDEAVLCEEHIAEGKGRESLQGRVTCAAPPGSPSPALEITMQYSAPMNVMNSQGQSRMISSGKRDFVFLASRIFAPRSPFSQYCMTMCKCPFWMNEPSYRTIQG